MEKLVRLLYGLWVKTEIGVWEFRSDQADLGFRAMIQKNETFDSLMAIMRTRWMLGSDENMTALVNILSTLDVFLYMGMRVGQTELTIYVTVGAEAVASYQF